MHTAGGVWTLVTRGTDIGGVEQADTPVSAFDPRSSLPFLAEPWVSSLPG